MDASVLIKLRRDRTLYEFYRTKRNNQPEQPYPGPSQEVVLDRILGGIPFYENNKLLDAPLVQTSCTVITSDPAYTIPITLDETVFIALDGILNQVASTNIGPTRSSRVFYLWFMTVVSGYNWVSAAGRISGTKDSWNWNTRYPLATENDIFVFVNHLMIDIMPTFSASFDTNRIVVAEKTALELSDSDLDAMITRVQTEGRYSDWKTAWQTWYTARGLDGNVAAAAVPDNSLLPNGAQTLNVSTTSDDPNTFVNPQKWVPLIVGGSKKNYLTYGWGSVTSSCLTAGDESTLYANVQTYFPGTASTYNDGSPRALEIAALVSLNGSLTDMQKMIAEFWAGGPFTVSPPGMMIWLWKEYMASTLTAHTVGFDQFFYSGLDLAIHLFEAGRLVWELKKNNMQARPIQEIRRMYRGQTITNYDGTSILGETWIPYQASNFVTPPFPDFPSGHTAYSKSFADVMTTWFGNNIPSTTARLLTDLAYLSAIFKQNQTKPLANFTIYQGTSEIQTGVVPASNLELIWTTWSDLAESAGISRQYGGIHATSAHTGSVALATQLHSLIATRWSISSS
jgi:hypothetical protein